MAWYIVLVLLCVSCVEATNCRGEEPKPRSCENLCDENGNCTVRAALLLPRNTSYDASLTMVESALQLALQQEAVKQAFPDWVQFEWLSYDVEDCDSAYAVIGAIDAYNDCAHVFMGPSCDFALAGVARIAKFLGSTGTPMLTTGGFSFDFSEPKQNCSAEYYMLVRAGTVSFKDIAFFLIRIMKQFEWGQLQLIIEPEAQVNVAGMSSCHLMMKTFANYLKKEKIDYTPWDTTSDAGRNFTENLIQYPGNQYTSKSSFTYYSSFWSSRSDQLRFGWNQVMLLYDTPAYKDQVGEQGGFLLANNIHMYMTIEGIPVFGREMQPSQSHEDLLLQSVGNEFAIVYKSFDKVDEKAEYQIATENPYLNDNPEDQIPKIEAIICVPRH